METPQRIFDLLYYQQNKFPEIDVFASKVDSSWKTIPTLEFIEHVNKISQALIAFGINPGDKVGVISENR